MKSINSCMEQRRASLKTLKLNLVKSVVAILFAQNIKIDWWPFSPHKMFGGHSLRSKCLVAILSAQNVKIDFLFTQVKR